MSPFLSAKKNNFRVKYNIVVQSHIRKSQEIIIKWERAARQDLWPRKDASMATTRAQHCGEGRGQGPKKGLGKQFQKPVSWSIGIGAEDGCEGKQNKQHKDFCELLVHFGHIPNLVGMFKGDIMKHFFLILFNNLQKLSQSLDSNKLL